MAHPYIEICVQIVWIYHCDFARRIHKDLARKHIHSLDLRLGIPFTDDSIYYIYTSHTLEHISKTSAQELMREAHRTLKRGGIIRVCVPDLEQAVKLYQQGNRTEALAYFFPDSEFEFHQHKYMYDFALLKQLLEDSGFKDVRRCEYQQGLMPDLDRLDNRPMQTLFVEAAKG